MRGTSLLSLKCQGHERRCLLHVPTTGAGWPRALVLMLHGAGATAQWALEETGWEHTAEREGFLLALPEALPLDPTRSAQFHRNPNWWNDGSPAARSAKRSVDDVHFLDQLIDAIQGEHPLDCVCATGFSNGAAMTFRLAAEGERSLTALAPVAGYCWLESPRLVRPLPTLYLLGREDPLVPFTGGRVRSPWGWTENRPPVQETITLWQKALAGRPELTVEVIEGLGHHWPGGRGVLSRRLFGPPSDKVKANERIWEFFRSVATR